VLLAAAAFVVLFALLFLGVPIAFGLLAVGFVGFALLQGLAPALHMVGQLAFSTPLNEELSVIPLFVLMGAFIAASRLSDELYAAANALLGHLRGGLAMATVVACAGFASVCGSSFATAATMTKVALPPMRRFGYADSLAAGAIASGATLGIMIPPSVPLLLYGIMTRTDISKLFIAGIVPGLLGGLLYLGAVALATWRNPRLGPPGERSGARERVAALARVWAVVALFVFIIGGIYAGWFTPTEAAGIGAFVAFLLALARRGLGWRKLGELLLESAATTATILVLLIGALIFSNFIDIAGVPRAIAAWVGEGALAPVMVIVLIIAIYLVLGCILDSMSMMFLTVPVFYPVVAALGYDLVWFGIIVVTVIEISLITPPIGLNVFVLHQVQRDIPAPVIFRGVLPFVGADLIRVALLVAFPAIALVLPSLM
jgi:tripartite ATP-independent transporter DctM subunit